MFIWQSRVPQVLIARRKGTILKTPNKRKSLKKGIKWAKGRASASFVERKTTRKKNPYILEEKDKYASFTFSLIRFSSGFH